MRSFKTWLEDEVEVGEPRGPKPTSTDAVAGRIFNKAITHPSNSNLTPSLTTSPNRPTTAKILSNFATGAMRRNKSMAAAGRITPDLLAKRAADSAGVPFQKVMAGMKKGMKKK